MTYGDSFWSVKACLDRQSELCHSMRNISYLKKVDSMLLNLITPVDLGLTLAFFLTFLGSCWFCLRNYGVDNFSDHSAADGEFSIKESN